MVDPPWQFWTNWIVQAAVAIGTLAAVVVALFGKWLRAKWVPPCLQLSIENHRGTKSPCIISKQGGPATQSESRWYHLKLENARRWSPAPGTDVLLLNLEEEDAAGRFNSIWRGAMPIKWRSFGYLPGGRTVGYPAECDLLSVVRDGGLDIHPVVIEFPMNAHRNTACKFVMTVQARSIDADSNVLRIQIAWDGNWADGNDEMMRHLVITVLSDSYAN